MPADPSIPLPAGWPAHTRAALLRAVALAQLGLVHARSWCADSRITRVRLAGENDALRSEAAALREELRIKDARLARIDPHKRPHYPPSERLAILALRAARGWSAAEAARLFQVSGVTISSWMKRLDEDGANALVKTARPVHRFPDFVRELVRSLHATLPAMGKVRIAQILARGGVHLAPSTVQRMAKEQRRPPAPITPSEGDTTTTAHDPEQHRGEQRVSARAPHEVWHVDLTLVPIVSGMWVPWIPQSLLQRGRSHGA
jgi:transposase-like protein